MLQSLVELKSKSIGCWSNKNFAVKIKVNTKIFFYGTAYIKVSQWVPSTACGRSACVYIKLVKHVKHSTNKLRIVNVNRCKSGYKFNFSLISTSGCRADYFRYKQYFFSLKCDTPTVGWRSQTFHSLHCNK